jgi:hypothetical protein
MLSNGQAASLGARRPGRLDRFLSPLASIHKRASSVERFLILFGFLAGGWFTVFDIYPPSDSLAYFTDFGFAWALLFYSCSVFHLSTLALDGQKWRKFCCLYHSVVWGFWVLLAYTAIRPTMATPLAFGLAAMALYEAIRLRLAGRAKVDDRV